MKHIEVLRPGETYHIYNRAVSSDLLFTDSWDYYRFLKSWEDYLDPYVEILAYCLMPNHFHFLARTRLEFKKPYTDMNLDADQFRKLITRKFRALFTGYAVYFNRKYNRKGKLFMLPYKRILVDSDAYLISLIYYIHRNPIHHGYVNHPGDWEYSSYSLLINEAPTLINRKLVLNLYGGADALIKAHSLIV